MNHTENVNIRVIATDIGYIKAEVSEIKAALNSGYVTKDQFEPVRNIVYGLVALILVSVVGVLISLALKK